MVQARFRNGFEGAVHHPSAPDSRRFTFTPAEPAVIDTGDTIGLDIDFNGIADVVHDRRTGDTTVTFPAPSDCVQPTLTTVDGELRLTALIERLDSQRVRINAIPCPTDRQASVARLFTPEVEERTELLIGVRVIQFMSAV